MPPAHQARGGGRVGGRAWDMLRVGTHNVQGLVAHLQPLVEGWMRQRLDVVLLQETWVTFFQAAKVCRQLDAACRGVDPRHEGYQVVWGFNTAGNASRSAGVAVLVRRALVNSGQLTIRQQQVVATPQGRLVVLPMQWGGHDLKVVSAYLPNSSTDQQAFINDCMHVHLQGQDHLVCAGDFNFVESTCLDEVSTTQQHGAPVCPSNITHNT